MRRDRFTTEIAEIAEGGRSKRIVSPLRVFSVASAIAVVNPST